MRWVSATPELEHHGILGMKWGVRNGPPYPLKPSVSKRISDGATAEKSGSPPDKVGGIVSRMKERRVEKKRLNDLSKNENDWDKLTLSKRMDLIRNAKKDPTLASRSEAGIEAARKGVNPHYSDKPTKANKNAYTYNCVLCSWTYELRRRGYDLEAMPTQDPYGLDNDKAMQAFKSRDGSELKRDRTSVMDYDDFMDVAMSRHFKDYQSGMEGLYQRAIDGYMSSVPSNARGLLVMRGFGGGHCVAWERMNGKLYIVDAQDNSYISTEDMFKMGVVSLDFGRTDNAVLSDKIAFGVRPPTVSKKA